MNLVQAVDLHQKICPDVSLDLAMYPKAKSILVTAK